MKILQAITLAALILMLAACNSTDDIKENTGSADDGAPTNAQTVTDHGVSDKSGVGFEMTGGNIEEAKNVPQDEKEALLAAFDEYMEAFNVEDVDRYMSVISKNPEGFNYDDEKILMEKTFEEYNMIRTVENVTIVEYNDKQAQVFANMHTALEQPGSGTKFDRDGRQVTVFAKEEGKWLVTSVYHIAESAE